jgi:PilZ domain
VNVSERRKAQRFSVRQPVTVTYTSQGTYEVTGISKDISSVGIFLHVDSGVEEGTQVELTLALPTGTSGPIPVPVRGRVVRVEKDCKDIAIAFERIVILPESWKAERTSGAELRSVS